MSDKQEFQRKLALIRRIEQIVGYVPMGTRDLLNILKHPDVIAHTKEWLDS